MKMLDTQRVPTCPLYQGIDCSLIPWPGMRYACVRVLELYGKVFDQQELCELIVRKTCSGCKCPREEHEVYHVEWVNVKERLGFKASAEPDKQNSRDRSHSEGYAWVPPGLPSYKIEQFFRSLPAAKVPKLGTAGEKYRDKQLVVQLPKQDLALTYCKHVEPAHYSSYEDFVNARNEIALDIAYAKEVTATTVCAKCKEAINTDDIAILAPKLGDQSLWHPGCFVCSCCDQLLVDLTYCVHYDQLYCERHYAEQLKPRCSACDEVMFIHDRSLRVVFC